MTSVEKQIAADELNAQDEVDALITSCVDKRVRLRVTIATTSLEYVGRVPRESEMRKWPAGQKFGAGCILARPGSHDPANPISPQVHYLRAIDGEWCIVRMRLQDSDPLEIRRVGRTVTVTIEALGDD